MYQLIEIVMVSDGTSLIRWKEFTMVSMLMRSDPFRELDRLSQQMLGGVTGTVARPSVMPMDAWREGHTFVIEFDLPGVRTDAIDLDVERNVVTVRAERPVRDEEREMLASERARGVFSRQLVLGDNLDTERIEASYDAGVLTLRIPVAEHAKPRKIAISDATASGDGPKQISGMPSHHEDGSGGSSDRQEISGTVTERQEVHA